MIEDCDDLAQDVVLDYLTALRCGRKEMITTGLPAFVGVMVILRLFNASRSRERRRHREDEFARWGEAIGHEWR